MHHGDLTQYAKTPLSMRSTRGLQLPWACDENDEHGLFNFHLRDIQSAFF